MAQRLDDRQLEEMLNRTVIDLDGNKIGKIGQIYLDDQSGQAQWVSISTGLFGNKENFAPLQGATMSGDDVQLGVSKELVKDAPKIEADGHLDGSEIDALREYYADYSAAGTPEPAGNTTAGPQGSEAVVTLSEEQLHVGTERVETGRARLRKYVVTENVTQTVPVSHEEVRVVREPISDGNAAGEIAEDEQEITLHAERPVVSKDTVAVEQVRMGTETITEDQTVSEQVRKEQVDAPDTQPTDGT